MPDAPMICDRMTFVLRHLGDGRRNRCRHLVFVSFLLQWKMTGMQYQMPWMTNDRSAALDALDGTATLSRGK